MPSKRTTRLGELADEKNYPLRPRPSGSPCPPHEPLLVRLASLLHDH